MYFPVVWNCNFSSSCPIPSGQEVCRCQDQRQQGIDGLEPTMLLCQKESWMLGSWGSEAGCLFSGSYVELSTKGELKAKKSLFWSMRKTGNFAGIDYGLCWLLVGIKELKIAHWLNPYCVSIIACGSPLIWGWSLPWLTEVTLESNPWLSKEIEGLFTGESWPQAWISLLSLPVLSTSSFEGKMLYFKVGCCLLWCHWSQLPASSSQLLMLVSIFLKYAFIESL